MLMRLLLGFEKHQKEVVYYNNKDISIVDRIVIAHRLSIVQDCYRILVLEEGNYEMLTKKQGVFALLVEYQQIYTFTNELIRTCENNSVQNFICR